LLLHFTLLNLVYSIRGFVMNFVTKFLSVLGLTVALTTNVVAAVVLVTDSNGILTGANGVSVNSSLYDVTFGDGFYRNSITSFTTRASAAAATSALATVLKLSYDSQPELISGCTSSIVCSIVTPYEIISTTVYTLSWNNFTPQSGSGDSFTGPRFSLAANSTSASGTTVALWKLSPTISAVPEPETYAMFLAGLGLLGFVSRRRKQKAAD